MFSSTLLSTMLAWWLASQAIWDGGVAAGLRHCHRRIRDACDHGDIDGIVPLEEGVDRVLAVAVGVLQPSGIVRSDVSE